MNFDFSKDQLMDIVLAYGPKLVMVVLTLLIGLWVIKMVGKGLRVVADKRHLDPILIPYLISITKTVLKIMLLITVLGMMGIEMTSFIAILGAAGLAVGLALSGTLQNFAGGVMLLIFKPFKVGDFVEVSGYTGTVSQIQIFNTIMKTGDNKTIIIPNSAVSSSSMVNYSTEPRRRVDMDFGIGYNDDIDKAKATLQKLIDADERILKDPEPFIAVAELADSSVNFKVRVWCESANYWGIFFDMQENVKKTFDKEGISIPYPQTDVHIHNN